MINPGKILKLKGAWDTFASNHPKFVLFLNAIHKSSLEPGTIIEINVTTPSGQTLTSNLKLSQTDIELVNEISDMVKN